MSNDFPDTSNEKIDFLTFDNKELPKVRISGIIFNAFPRKPSKTGHLAERVAPG